MFWACCSFSPPDVAVIELNFRGRLLLVHCDVIMALLASQGMNVPFALSELE